MTLVENIKNFPLFWYGLIVAIFAGIAIYAFRRIFKQLKLANIIKETPRSKIRSAAQGYVELHGKAKFLDKDKLYAPLSGEACCWYQYKVEEKIVVRNPNGGSTVEWRLLDDSVSLGLFQINDGTGNCVVHPVAAKVKPKTREIWYGRYLNPQAERSHRSWWKKFMYYIMPKPYRFTEWRIDDDEDIFSLGFFKTCYRQDNPLHGSEYREKLDDMREKLTQSSLKYSVLSLPAKNFFFQQGKNLEDNLNRSSKQWENLTSALGQTETINCLIKRERPFIISSFSEKNY